MENNHFSGYPSQGNANGNLDEELEKLTLNQDSIWSNYSQPSSMRGSEG